MTLLSLYHIGVLVADLDRASDHFSSVLGVTFKEPIVLSAYRIDSDGTEPFELRITYSREGPTHYELIEANDQDVYSISQGEGLHHVGLWSPDVRSEVGRLAKLGLHPHFRMSATDAGQVSAWYSSPEDSHGVRFEFVDESARENLEGWIRGEQ